MIETEIIEIAKSIDAILKKGNCILWLGSGLSLCAYPTWVQTIQKLCKQCKVSPLNENEEKSTKALMGKADECKNKNLDQYQQTLANSYGKTVGNTREAYHTIMKLPFRGYITTNYDPLLSSVAGHENNNIKLYPYPDLPVWELKSNPPSVFYIHGIARIDNMPTGKYLVLSTSEFNEAYEKEGIVSSFLVQLFTYYSVLFVGCQLTEPGIQKSLGQMKATHEKILTTKKREIPQKIILKGKEKSKSSLRNTEDSIVKDDGESLSYTGIDVLFYTLEDAKHREIEAIFNRVCDIQERPITTKPSSGLPEDSIS